MMSIVAGQDIHNYIKHNLFYCVDQSLNLPHHRPLSGKSAMHSLCMRSLRKKVGFLLLSTILMVHFKNNAHL